MDGGEVPRMATGSGFAEMDGWTGFPKSGSTGRGRGQWGGGHVSSVPGKFHFRGPKEMSGEQPVKQGYISEERVGPNRRELWTFYWVWVVIRVVGRDKKQSRGGLCLCRMVPQHGPRG